MKKKIRSRQDSNLCGETPFDFESNALTTRPRLRLLPWLAGAPTGAVEGRLLLQLWPDLGSTVTSGSVLASAVHILKLERYRED